MSHRLSLLLLLTGLMLPFGNGMFEDTAWTQQRELALGLRLGVQERTGVLLPMYIYPANIEENQAYNRLVALKRLYKAVPIWVVINPASGPGEEIDPNYTMAIDRLLASGCRVLGYVTTGYGARSSAIVRKDIDRWLRLYPHIQGIFFDEMIHQDTQAGANYQMTLNRYAHEAGCWLTVGNPGTDAPRRYFAARAADVIIIYEGGSWPKERQLKGKGSNGHEDFRPFERGVLIYGQQQLDRDLLRMVRRYARWVYVTEAEYRPGQKEATNPWDRLSKHLEAICDCIREP